jgi:hypothetical protein
MLVYRYMGRTLARFHGARKRGAYGAHGNPNVQEIKYAAQGRAERRKGWEIGYELRPSPVSLLLQKSDKFICYKPANSIYARQIAPRRASSSIAARPFSLP